MCNHDKMANEMLLALEENFQFSEEEKVEALLLCLQIMEDEKLFDESVQT